jgi:HSP20 family molecular chaperone IbpA
MNPIKGQERAFRRQLAAAWASLSMRVRKMVRSKRGLASLKYRHAAAQTKESRGAGAERLAGEIWETARAVVVQIEMPGMGQEDIQVSFSRGRLRIRGDKRRIAGDSQRRTYHLRERAFGRFERRIALPHETDTARAEVSHRDGVVTVIIPKLRATPPARPTP